MTKRFLTLAATAAMVVAFSPQMFAAIDMQLAVTANGVTATINLDTLGNLSVNCTGTVATCGTLQTTGPTAGGSLFGGKVLWDGTQNGTLSLTQVTLNGYTISDTASGWADSAVPTLQTFNQVVAQGGTGTVGAEFTDINYNTPGTPLSSILNAADSNVTDSQINTSTIMFSVLTDSTNSVPAGGPVRYTNTLTGSSNSNGVGGVNFANPATVGSVSISSNTLLTFAGTGKIQANMTISNVAVPEPAGIVLLGTMVLGLTGLIRKKQAKRS